MSRDPVRIANCSGFYGDRLSAAAEMVGGGPIDVLTGDWLAELTMLILAKDRMRNPDGGYAKTFVAQLRDVLATCVERGIRIVSNAGGLNPSGCAAAVEALAAELGVTVRVAAVVGDDLLDDLTDLRAAGETLTNLDTGEAFADVGVEAVTANAYLGGWGIAESLRHDADIVITGRVTDAALIVGAGAWWHGWERTDWDELAGAVVAGHIIECGTQCTGGNFAFFDEVPDLSRPGFPIAELAGDGSCVITKHPGTGGAVTVDTITAQLLYEIQGLQYLNPDAAVWLNSIHLRQDGPDRVLVHDVRGAPGPERLKVCINYLGGFRNSMTFAITGLDVEAKAALALDALWGLVDGGRAAFAEVDETLIRSDREDPATNDDAIARLRVTVMDPDETKVGRSFSNKAIELVLANYPGLFTTTPPTGASSFGVYWPTTVPADAVDHAVLLDGERLEIGPAPRPPAMTARRTPKERGEGLGAAATPVLAATDAEGLQALLGDIARQRTTTSADDTPWWDEVETTVAPLGRVLGARSGDKGGNANIGVWARTDDAYDWLAWFLTVDRLRDLLPAETAGLEVERFELPNLRALNFVVHGLLGRGVAACTRTDPQAKGLGEYLRAKHAPVPTTVLGATELARLERSDG